jgi:hypothetical protein
MSTTGPPPAASDEPARSTEPSQVRLQFVFLLPIFFYVFVVTTFELLGLYCFIVARAFLFYLCFPKLISLSDYTFSL